MGKTPDFQVPMSTELFIDGQFVAGEGEAERVLNPATGEVIAQVPEASYEQIHKAVLGASRAFDTWSETTPMERSRLLLKLADAIEARAEAFALSFDEVTVTTFTAGQQTTLPIWMLQELIRPRQRPVTNVVAVAIIALTFLPIVAAYWLTRSDEPTPR